MNQVQNEAAASLINRAFSGEYSYASSVLMLQAAAKLDKYINSVECERQLMDQWIEREYNKRSIK